MFFRRQKNILIIRQDRIGDVVLSTALPREIKLRWPAARVTVLLRPYTHALYQHNPHVDEILLDEPHPEDDRRKRRTFRELVRRLRRRRFSHALMLLPQARYNYATFLAGIPVRVGVGVILYHLITGARWVMRHKYRDRRHEADYCLDLIRKIGVAEPDPTPEIHLTTSEQTAVNRMRKQWRAEQKRLVGVQVTSGGSAPNWPPARYRDLIEILQDSRLDDGTSLQLLVTDNELPAEVAGLPQVLYPNAGQDLRQALVNFAALDVLVSASTGPMHICAALKVPTVSLFCPEPSCAPERWRPLGNRATVLLPESDYCNHRCPGNTHACTFAGEGGLDPQRVATATLASLTGSLRTEARSARPGARPG